MPTEFILRKFTLMCRPNDGFLHLALELPRFSSPFYTVCHTRYRTRDFFNNCNTNEDIATKFEQEYVRCVRNEEECVCSPLQVSLQYPH